MLKTIFLSLTILIMLCVKVKPTHARTTTFNESNTKWLNITNVIKEQCLLCNADTVRDAIELQNLTHFYNGK